MRKKIFLDLEFAEKPGEIELISIGMAKMSGETLYMVADYDKSKPSEWVNSNVIPQLDVDGDGKR